MVIGIERELREQAAGLRTHMLVAVGACLFTLVERVRVRSVGGDHAGDPSRVAAQIVTGIGFLGAGAILREGQWVRGLTTAASLWVVAAVGMAVGLGLYLASGVAVVHHLVEPVGAASVPRAAISATRARRDAAPRRVHA